MQRVFACLLLVLAMPVMAVEQRLACHDELGRMSTILTFDVKTGRAQVDESGDAFVCGPGFEKYCTTSEGWVEQTPTMLRFTWERDLTGERTVYEVNTDNLTYLGEYAGGVWEGQCEPAAIE